MPNYLRYILFFFIALTIFSSIHYYIWRRLFKNTGLPDFWEKFSLYIIFTLLIYFIFAQFLSRMIPFNYSLPFLWLAYLWIGTMLLIFICLVFVDVIRFIIFIFSKIFIPSNSEIDLERRQLISQITASGVSIAVAAASGISVFNYLSKPIVKKLNISLNGLPQIFDGFRIVQISDLHVGQLMTKATLQEVVQQVNDLNPDLIAITGDLVDGSLDKLSNVIAPIKDFSAQYGVFFVTGNHEYFNGAEKWIAEIKNLGITVLENENVKIERNTDSFILAGVNDHEASRFGNKHAADLNKALSQSNNNNVVLLAHQPIAANAAAEYNVDLVLSGHTHGGQIWPINYLVYLQQPYIKGLYSYKNTQIYVNQGTGCWGPPMRLGTQNEITEITLMAV